MRLAIITIVINDEDQIFTGPGRFDTADYERLREGRHHDPHALLGRHACGPQETILAHLPRAALVSVADNGTTLERYRDTDYFHWSGPAGTIPEHYRLSWCDEAGRTHRGYDPYTFEPGPRKDDLERYSAGEHFEAFNFLGSHVAVIDGITGVSFATWAPNAERVSVVGAFNEWDGRQHPMRSCGESGVWALFIPGLTAGELYKFEIRGAGGRILTKTDPYARAFEHRPATASIVCSDSAYAWDDDEWMHERRGWDWLHCPMSIYEVHLGSWRRDGSGAFLNYRAIADQLVRYVKRMGYTHVELLPIAEHPLDASWGYQTTGYFAPTSRFGDPDDFRYLVDRCHGEGIGIILDWAAGHFPKDDHALAKFDGTALYEHHDARLAEHPDWGTLIFNFGRREVVSFLLSNAYFWFEQFHIDGLRVDAVASMLYLDYSRKAGDWIPNIHGGRENLEAIDFLKTLNQCIHREFPGALTIAEESTDWPQVSRPVYAGGLGFSMKWNMGWMHDTLSYLSQDPVHRKFHHDEMTFGLLYAFHENFVLPLSHDEVVHGKRSLLSKLPGDAWQRFATLRLLFTLMATYPGKKLLFMGNELAPESEWSHDVELPWGLLDEPDHAGCFELASDALHLYRSMPALHRFDFESRGFEWIDCHDVEQSVLSYLRYDEHSHVAVILNFTPVVRHAYRVGVPCRSRYREVLNSDAACYGGSNVGNLGGVDAAAIPHMGREFSLELTLPPLAGLVLAAE